MNNIWKITPLEDCLSKIIDYRGKTPKKLGGDWTKSGFRVLSANNVKFNGLEKLDSVNFVDQNLYSKWMKEEVKRGDLLLTSEAPSGQVMVWNSDEKIVLGQRLFALRVNKEINNRYLKYYLQSSIGQKEIFRNNSGSTVSGISAKTFGNILIRHPDIFYQEKIGDFLYSLDKKIEINNLINTELEAMAKTLYDYWFVQFDFPDANGKPYKSSDGKMVYSPILKREIPEGWRISKVGSVTKTELGGTPSTKVDSYWENANIPWLSSAETASFPVVSAEQMVTQSGIDNSAATLLPKGTVVISIVRYIRPSILGIDAATNQSVVGIRENENLKKSFIYPYFCNEVPRLMGLRGGAQQPHINKGTIDDSPIVIPSPDILESYYKFADLFYKEIINIAFQNKELTKLRDWILPMLMNGQITVR